MRDKPIIEITGLKKKYRMGQIGATTIKADWESFWAKRRGKEDPNVKIGQERLVGQTFMALNGIDLTVYPGEALGIIGVNGAGKSTLLKLISRITAPTEGRIVLRGTVASLLEVGTGFNGELTGRENIYLNGTILGMKKEEIDRKMDDIIRFSECGDFIDTPVKRYSSGMTVKLAFAVAANLDSDIMIMDEVLAVGDVKFQRKCISKMREAASVEGRTVLYVSHNMATIRQLCDRCIVLKEGRKIYDGDVEEAIKVYSEESFNFGMSVRFPQPEKYPGERRAPMLGLDILDKTELIYEADEKVKFRLYFKTIKDAVDLTFRCTVKYAGTTPVATCFSPSFSIENGRQGHIDFEMDISDLTEGKYTCDIYMGQVSVGRYITSEPIGNAFGFEIADNKRRRGLRWTGGYWGYSVLPDIGMGDIVYE